MNLLYLDIFSGVSGDMFMGAMIDLGVELRLVEGELSKLRLTGYHLHAGRQQRSHIAGVKFDVHLEADHHHHSPAGQSHEHASHADEHHHGPAEADAGHQPHSHGHQHPPGHAHRASRDFAQIKRLIQDSALSEWVKEKSLSVFQRVAEAEGKIHGQPPEAVHFHEVGAIDSIVDIVGGCVALAALGKPRVLAAPVVDGTGWVDCAHGRFPIPTTATLEILGRRRIPVSQCDEPNELVTPTGAALLAEFAESFGPMQDLVPIKIGYGLGSRENRTRPNVLRAILAEPSQLAANPADRDWELDQVSVLETNIDDCSAEILGYFVERALMAGALDVFHTAIQMKKNRPGVLLTVLCGVSQADAFSEMILRETSAFGVRRSSVERRKLRREPAVVPTPFGEVAIKLGLLNGQVLHVTPEFESCKRLAAQAQVPLRAVYEAAEYACRNLAARSGTGP